MAPTAAVRLVVALAALAAGATALALAALLLQGTPGPVSVTNAQLPQAAPAPAASATPRFPAPPAHAVVFSREDGPDALAVAVVPHGRNVLAQASVVGQQGTGVSGLSVSFGSVRATACGAGCYRATLRRPRAIDLHVGGTHWLVPLPAPWPPRDASALVARATHLWRSLRTLSFYDRLASDSAHAVVSNWQVVAPDRLSYRIEGGYAAVIVGGRRWDKAPGGRWTESQQSVPVKQPVPVWQSATDARVVGATERTWQITFFDPRTPAWFAISVDKRTSRTLELRMITTAHFMHERYGSFDAPLSITPPS
ncbi:MAG TPA: hypothetical protein VFW41_06680 [Gaiellaceae bacterium]|nr:hypothetical protein [Gaiellaceae bacterium]